MRIAAAVGAVGAVLLAACTGGAGGPAPTFVDPASELPTVPTELVGELAFVSDRDGGTLQIFAIDVGDGGVTQLTEDPGIDHFHPAWSPDGTVLAYVSAAGGIATGEFDLHLLTDGTDTALTRGRERDADPAWSPDGSTIAFGSATPGRAPGIFVIDASGGESGAIFLGSFAAYQPAWSPDGSTIAVAIRERGCVLEDSECPQHIWLMDAIGGNLRQLTTGTTHDGDPAWSPDGSRIAYASGTGDDVDIWLMHADGSEPRRLTDSPGLDLNPTWSPDGSWIAFSSERTGNFDVFVMRPDGSRQTNVTNDPATDFTPTWQPVA
jgi:Tol biopolymer transport system component